MRGRLDDLKAGVMVLAGLVIFLCFLVWVYGVDVNPFDDPLTHRYYARYDFSGGITPGTTVRFGGMRAGQVLSVGVDPEDNSQIRIEFEVDAATPVKTDSEARITALSMLGDYYLEVTTGSNEAPRLQPDPETQLPDPNAPAMEITGIGPANMNKMLAKAEVFLEDLTGVVGRLDTTLKIVNEEVLVDDRAALRARIAQVFDGVDKLLADIDDIVNEENRANIAETLATIRGTLQENRPDLRTTITNVRKATDQLETLMTDVQGMIGDARPEVQRILAQLAVTIAKAETLVADLDAVVVENRPAIYETVQNMNATSANARTLTETLSEEPWRVIWRSAPPDDFAAAGRAR